VFFKLQVGEVHAQAWRNNINSFHSMEKIGFKLHKSNEKLFPKLNEKLMN
jgi:RimJ/RimL family protein N-acetyltransferase